MKLLFLSILAAIYFAGSLSIQADQSPQWIEFSQIADVHQTLSKNDNADVLSTLEYQGKDVQIRGFLYQSPTGKWILAAEPNLQSCCVGSEEKADKQIVLSEGFEAIGGYPLVVQGKFHADQKDDNSWTFRLDHPLLVEDAQSHSPYITMLTILLFVIAFGFLAYKKF